MAGRLCAISDLHVGFPENQAILDQLRAQSDDDWLLVAGDVGELCEEVCSTLAVLSQRFARVVWAPGNHELWTRPKDPVQLRGEERYRYLVDRCREIGVLTPEDPYPIWSGPGGPAIVAPLFLLYDYTFHWRDPADADPDHAGGHAAALEAAEHAAALEAAEAAGIMPTDELVLFSDPYPSREQWCAARLVETEARLSACDPALPTVLVNHFPLTKLPTRILHFPQFAPWCGTIGTADWHRRFRAAAVVYGHLHIPRTIIEDGVPFIEVSLGYPREWQRRRGGPRLIREILPHSDGVMVGA